MQSEADLHHRLAEWCRRVIDEAGLPPLDVDIDALLEVAGDAAHGVVRPAAPVTTFLVGYATGLASARGEDPAVAGAQVVAAVHRVLDEGGTEGSP